MISIATAQALITKFGPGNLLQIHMNGNLIFPVLGETDKVISFETIGDDEFLVIHHKIMNNDSCLQVADIDADEYIHMDIVERMTFVKNSDDMKRVNKRELYAR